MEEANVSKRHSDAVLVAGINNMIVTDTTACFCYVFNTTLMSTLNIVAEWEESITTYRYTLVLGNPSLLLLAGQWLRLLCKELLPNAVLQYILPLIGDIDIDGIVAVGTTDLLLKRQVHYLRTLAQPPLISLRTSQTGTVDTALLAGTDTDSLTILT